MKINRMLTATVLGIAMMAGTASAQRPTGPVEQGYVTYHYDSLGGPVVAVSGQNCDGSFYHEPLYLGAHQETFYFDC